ncbi:hypothetical protein O181_029949 [Austropuccinia psidii MF-1]|uniref:Peptidase A2 domain-containing protein n=1 Tax=Austropuccinia psidii MF-1 TaxID=1389203 RepID=A0A9Q3CT64_9BASI|nr:hypothetical protein [Austropuccinia psidii MF-1]
MTKAQPSPFKVTIQPKDTIKKNTSSPGGFIEEEEAGEESVIIPTKYSQREGVYSEGFNKTTKDGSDKELSIEEQGSIIERFIDNIMDQKINLTLEEIEISPIQIQEKITMQEIIIQDKTHYSCPLGMIEVSVGQKGHIVQALTEAGAELSIIPEVKSIKERLPRRVLKIRLIGIGGHRTVIVVLPKNTVVVLPSGYEKIIHLFIARGSLHIAIWRPFLSHNVIIIENSQ